MARRGRPPHQDVLTPREWEVLGLLREGLSNEQIAERLQVSLAGAKYHVSEILSKLGVENREEAARWQPRERPWWVVPMAPLTFILRKAAGPAGRGVNAAGVAIGGAMIVAVIAGIVLFTLLLSRGGGGSNKKTTSTRPPEPFYVRTQDRLLHFDESGGTAERTFETGGLRDNAASVDGRTFAVDVRRNGNEWTPIMLVLDSGNGSELNSVPLSPINAANAPVASKYSFSQSNQAHLWVSRRLGVVIVGVSSSDQGSTHYRLDIAKIDDPKNHRSIDLGTTGGEGGDIHLAMDSSADGVAVLLTTGRTSQLLVSDPALTAFTRLADLSPGCFFAGGSTEQADSRYFLCLDIGPDGVNLQASMMVFDKAANVKRLTLEGKFYNDLVGSAAIGNHAFIGNPEDSSVTVFQLSSGAMQHHVLRDSATSLPWWRRVFANTRVTYARQVAFVPIALSPDANRVFFTNGQTVWCLRSSDLAVDGRSSISNVTALAVSERSTVLFAAGDAAVHVLNGKTCSAEAEVAYQLQPGEPVEQILAP